jgi:EAL domain-containing protein (putative c-di-GMP-specific phosphodiesterase class I)
VAAMVNLANALELDSVGEGVETADQAERVRDRSKLLRPLGT